MLLDEFERNIDELTGLMPGFNRVNFTAAQEEVAGNALERTSNYSIQTNFGTREAQEIYEALVSEGLDQKFRGKLIVDLGCGPGRGGVLLAKLLDAQAYIGVDSRTGITQISRGQHPVPLISVKADMIDFAERLPAESCAIFLLGIDKIVLPKKDDRVRLWKALQNAVDPSSGILCLPRSDGNAVIPANPERYTHVYLDPLEFYSVLLKDRSEQE